MEVDVQVGAASVGLDVPIIIPDSGSSTEVDEDEYGDEGPQEAALVLASWPRVAATQVVRRRRARYGNSPCRSTDSFLLKL